MKTRNGFVSNSSSSSFIVCFPYKPADLPDMQRLLFGNETSYRDPYGAGGYAVSDVAATVLHDIKDQRPLTLSEVAEELDVCFDTNVEVPNLERPEFPDYPRELYDIKVAEERFKHPLHLRYHEQVDEYEQKHKEWQERMARTFIGNARGGEFYRFSYSDNDGGFYSALEHGDLFGKLPFIRVSNH